VADYRQVSYWLETAGDDLTPRAPLTGHATADVAIVGAGYTGLWTAYYLLARRPDLRVALVESDIAGYGASGRNGGWISSGFPVSPGLLARRFGVPAARSILIAIRDSIGEIARVTENEGLGVDLIMGGSLRIARGSGQAPAIRKALVEYEALGLGEEYGLLSSNELRERVRVRAAQGALFTPHCAVMHPGKLVRGLARTVERMGATIYEQSPVTRFEGAPSPRLVSREGSVEAGTVVLATEAYLTRFRGMRRRLLPVYSSIILTEPLPDHLWAEIGWEGREGLSSMRLTVDYLSRTADGRVLFGSRGVPYRYGSRISPEFEHDPKVASALRRLLASWFPALEGIRITHAWSGPVGMPRDWMPAVSYDRCTGSATAGGYTGQGVATSNLAGRVLGDLIAGTESEITRLPICNRRFPTWEPEPLRWLAVRYIQNSLQRVDEVSERTGAPPSGRSLAERLSRH
jgi:glycine/D-amino acid oxidase-like deaminating enzyme